MSLTLRKNTQDALNHAGLDDYHTRINSDKYLAIVGPCGQPLITVSGIEFTRREPTVAETEFACELFNEFLREHKQDINDYIKQLKQHSQAKAPPTENKQFAIGQEGYGNSADDHVEFRDGPFKYLMRSDTKSKGRIYSVHTTGTKTDVSSVIKYIPDAKLFGGALIFLNTWKAYKQAEEDLDAAKAKLSTCDI